MNKITILLVAPNNDRNTFIINLADSLLTFASVVIDEKAFWHPDENQQIIFLQWPERLSYRLGRKPLPPTSRRIKKISKVIDTWKRLGAKIIITRHNYLPHHYSTSYKELYLQIYKRCDAVHHFGYYSQTDFQQTYSDIKTKHVIIHHNGYWDIPNQKTKEQAREELGIAHDEKVLLTFGNLRVKEDEDLIINAYKELNHLYSKLLIPRGYYNNESLWYRAMSFIKIPIYKYLLNKKKSKLLKHSIHWDQQFIPRDKIQTYLNAADLLVIARTNSLNSGILYLGLTFGICICGPNIGNLGSILDQTENIMYDPASKDSLVEAIKRGLALSKTNIPERNKIFALRELSNTKIALDYEKFIRSLFGNQD